MKHKSEADTLREREGLGLLPTFGRCERKMLYFWNMSFSESQIKVQDIDHLDIVAGIINEMSWVEKINQLLGTHSQ